jgi:hypothetical protein
MKKSLNWFMFILFLLLKNEKGKLFVFYFFLFISYFILKFIIVICKKIL